jgi:hypothetical protein
MIKFVVHTNIKKHELKPEITQKELKIKFKFKMYKFSITKKICNFL